MSYNNKTIRPLLMGGPGVSITISSNRPRWKFYEDGKTYRYVFKDGVRSETTAQFMGPDDICWTVNVPQMCFLAHGTTHAKAHKEFAEILHRNYQDLVLADPKTLDEEEQCLVTMLRKAVMQVEVTDADND